jgi:hypothetical protein
MRSYELGTRVYGNDGKLWGRLAQLVLQPETHAVSHVVVYAVDDGRARLVPISLTHRVRRGIRLSCSSDRIEAMASPVEVHLVAPPSGHGSAKILRWPMAHLRSGTEKESMRLPIEAGERLAPGSVTVWQKEPVEAADGEVGCVRGLILDEESYDATHLVVEEKHFGMRKRVAIPIEAAAEFRHEFVRMHWTQAAVRGLRKAGGAGRRAH